MSDAEPRGASSRADLAAGFCAMLPLLVLYELALRGSEGRRGTAELMLLYPFEALGVPAAPLRWVALALLGALAARAVARSGRGLLPATLRVVVEGLALGLVLGPLLVGWMRLLSDVVALPPLSAAAAGAPALARTSFVVGAAAWEELFCRVLVFGALYAAGRRVALFLGSTPWVSEIAADALAIAGSALVFASLHLTAFSSWLGSGGEAFDPSTFTWRLGAGILLGLLYRWRGPGVAAWSHGLLNLALLLGFGPDVFAGGEG